MTLTRTRKTGAERREQIARGALDLVGERGLSGLTTAAIAEAASLSSGAIFRHFDSRDAILLEAVRIAARRIDAAYPDPAAPPVQRLMQLARHRVALLSTDAGLAWLLRSDEARLALPPDAVEVLAGVVARSRAFLLDAIEQGCREGSIRRDLAAGALLVIVMGTIQALIGMSGLHGDASSGRPDTIDEVLDALEAMITA